MGKKSKFQQDVDEWYYKTYGRDSEWNRTRRASPAEWKRINANKAVMEAYRAAGYKLRYNGQVWKRYGVDYEAI